MSRHDQQVAVALKRGRQVSSKTNTRVEYEPRTARLLTFDGPHDFPTSRGARALLSFDGPIWQMTGTLRFFHWDTEVLVVNFDEGWVTDHGYTGYSLTTDRNLSEWLWSLSKLGYLSLPPRWHRWTTTWRDGRATRRTPRGVVREVEQDLVVFRAGVPWAIADLAKARAYNPTTWRFYWKLYDEDLADAFWRSREHLATDNNRRYFRYDWSVYVTRLPKPQHWERKFIDKDAERRWVARERRNGRHAHVPDRLRG